ncbi:hypothetical protein [Priestia flexa]|uniref:hypothetical protein n=1 Tax=Priestia flexa TaxID=86664 RepID=UPI00047374BD|nr:hypothetical protein [Priestia flexa]
MIKSIHVLNGGEEHIYKLGEKYFGQEIIKIAEKEKDIHVLWFKNGDFVLIKSKNTMTYHSMELIK